MSIFLLVAAIGLLLLLITVLRFNAFMALTITAFAVGFAKQMPLDTLIKSIQSGIGSTLGGLIMVMGFGVMLGAILSETGAAQQISDSLIRAFGVRRAKWAILITGFSVGLAMFYNAGFVVLIPMVFLVAARTNLPLVYLGVAMASSLSVTHGFLPPHPGPTAIVVMFKADMGRTLLLGLVAAIPAMLLSGIIFPEFVKNIKSNPPDGLVNTKIIDKSDLPSFGLSFIVALSPVFLMAIRTVSELLLNEHSTFLKMVKFIGDPSISMLIGTLVALFFLTNRSVSQRILIYVLLFGIFPIILNFFDTEKRKDFQKNIEKLMSKSGQALSASVMILLIIAAGGAFKQVLTDSGIGKDIADLMNGSNFPPLLLGWLVATMVRISIGSATVAGLMAAGIVQPLLAENPSVSPELMVLSIGAGSLMCSHVNDTGFWMFKEYFGLSLKDTFKTWTLMETIVGITGLTAVLILDMFV